jgi:RecQ-mediated genome instability protein 1
VNNLIGLSPEEVTLALSGESMLKSISEMKEALRGFQKFLVNFEVGLLVFSINESFFN